MMTNTLATSRLLMPEPLPKIWLLQVGKTGHLQNEMIDSWTKIAQASYSNLQSLGSLECISVAEVHVRRISYLGFPATSGII